MTRLWAALLLTTAITATTQARLDLPPVTPPLPETSLTPSQSAACLRDTYILILITPDGTTLRARGAIAEKNPLKPVFRDAHYGTAMYVGFFAMAMGMDPMGGYTLSDAEDAFITKKCGNQPTNPSSLGCRRRYERRLSEVMDAINDESQLNLTGWKLAYAKELFNHWYDLEKADMDWLKDLPSCPCQLRRCKKKGFFGQPNWFVPTDQGDSSEWSVTSETMFEMFGIGTYFHPGADIDLRSRTHNGARQQCTYKITGTMTSGGGIEYEVASLITHGEGAPTADRRGGLFSHQSHDIAPFDLARLLDGGLFGSWTGKYLEVRPPNRGNDCPRLEVNATGTVNSCQGKK